MKHIQITVLACQWQTITSNVPSNPWPLSLLSALFSSLQQWNRMAAGL